MIIDWKSQQKSENRHKQRRQKVGDCFILHACDDVYDNGDDGQKTKNNPICGATINQSRFFAWQNFEFDKFVNHCHKKQNWHGVEHEICGSLKFSGGTDNSKQNCTANS